MYKTAFRAKRPKTCATRPNFCQTKFFKLKEGATRPAAREAPCTITTELFPLALAAVSSTLYSSRLRKHKNTYKNTTKLSNGIKVYENTSICKVHVITQKRGIIQTVLTKSIDKCHYLHTQNNYNLALNNKHVTGFHVGQWEFSLLIEQTKWHQAIIGFNMLLDVI